MNLWQIILTGLISFLFGGISAALFHYVKFNGRLIRVEAELHSMMLHGREQQLEIEKKIDRIVDRLDNEIAKKIDLLIDRLPDK
jgi:hypothetical protein